MTAWQDFASAPKDGDPVVVWRADAGWFVAIWESPAECAAAESWPDDDPRQDDWEACWWTADGEDLTDDLPTHWMRPEPPP